MSDSNNKVEEEFTIARLCINEMQSEVKDLVLRCQALETFKVDCNKKIYEHKRKLLDYRQLVSQHEARIVKLTESTEEAEVRKRALEEDVGSLRKECAKLKAAELVQAVNNKEKAEKEEAATKLRITLEKQIDQLQVIHQKLIESLRDEISEKQKMVNELEEQMNQLRDFHQHQIVTLVKKMSAKNEVINKVNDQNQKLMLAHKKIQTDYLRLKQATAKETADARSYRVI